MLKNYLRTAFNNLVKNKLHSSINILSLSVGMAVAMLIGFWCWDELSFNKYHHNYDRIAQIVQKEKFLGGIKVWTQLPYRLLDELKTNYSDNFQHIEAAIPAESYSLSAGVGGDGEKTIWKDGLFIGAGAPAMLTLKMLKGSWSGLQDPHSILLSAAAAKALFGDADPMEKTVRLNDNWDANNHFDVKVTGVYEDLPHNTEFHDKQFFCPFDLYVALYNNPQYWMNWKDHRFLIYTEIRRGIDPDKVAANIKNSELRIIQHLDNLPDEVASNPQLLLHPMSDWHLYSSFKDGVAERGPIQFVWLMGIIGSFVLLLACVNFMNLSTARSEKSAREVGIRKTIGSTRGQLIFRFFSESLMVVVAAFILGCLWVTLALPGFNELAAKQINIPWASPWFWLFSLAFILFTGLLAGMYPALYLSSFKPVKVLKGVVKAGRLEAIPRKVLVVFQFTVSIVLIIGTVVVYNQLLFTKDRPVGYTRDGLLLVPMKSNAFYGKYDILRSELKNTGVVAEMAQSESPVTGVSSHNGGFSWKGKTSDIAEDFGTLQVTCEYGKTVGWQFVAGRDFSTEYRTDSSGFVINESAAKFMHLQHPVGETIGWKSEWLNIDKNFQILGVIKDMVMQSPYEPVKPTIFRLGGNPNWIYIRLNPKISAGKALPAISAVFKRLIPSTPFEYEFANLEYAKKFATEERIGKLAGLFALFAIFISCMGLFGMASFMTEQRFKEIGVRKVLGAGVLSLWGLLAKDFVRLVVIAMFIAMPMAYLVMYRWLENYPYHTVMSWWIFTAAGAGILVVTLCTVSFQSLKAATMNPVKSLKAE